MEGHTGKSCYLYTAEQVFILKPKMVHTRIKTVCLFARCVNEVRVHIFILVRTRICWEKWTFLLVEVSPLFSYV